MDIQNEPPKTLEPEVLRADDSKVQRFVERCRTDERFFIESCVSIIDRDTNVEIPFKFNFVQDYYETIRSKFDIILKSRKFGMSTRMIAGNIWACAFQPNQNVVLINQDKPATIKMLEERVKPILRSIKFPINFIERRDMIIFPDTKSRFSVATAGTKTFGRGSDITRYHLSEVAQWPTEDLITSVEEACLGTATGVMETTANGANFFMRMWKAAVQGNSRYKPIFIPWFRDPDYRLKGITISNLSDEENKLIEAFGLDLEQIAWYRNKKRDMSRPELLPQEYPSTCVSGETLICTDCGIVPIKDAAEINSVDGNNVSCFIPRGKKKTITLITENWRKLRVTPDHLIAMSNGSFRQAVDLLVGDRVKLYPATFSNVYCKIFFSPMPCVKSEIIINEDWGRFLGYFMGDGSFCDTALSFCIDKKDIDLIVDYKNLVRKLFGLDLQQRTVGNKGGGIELRVASTKLKDIFDAMGIVRTRISRTTGELYGGRIRDVKIPSVIFKSPRSVIREFLSALFECDGCAYEYASCVMFFTKYERFARDINFLLSGFGINAKIKKVAKKARNGNIYEGFEMRLALKNSRQFHREISFISSRKKACSKGKQNENNKRYCVRTLEIPDHDIISSIEQNDEEEVFDLTVPGINVFGADGILVHNCEEAFISSGRLVFDWVALIAYEKIVENSSWTGFLRWNGDAVEFQPQERGNLHIWKYPVDGHRYVIGGDVSEGLVQGAYSALFVLDVNTSEQVAEWHGKTQPDRLADVMANLGNYYHNALLIPESWPGPGNITTLRLLDLGYKNMWARPARSNRNNPEQLWGWETTGRTRPLMLHALAAAVRDYKILIKSRGLLDELKSVIYDDGGDMTSQAGCYSDRVMACAIAWYVSREIADGLPQEKPSLRLIELALRRNALSGFATTPRWEGPRYGVKQ